MKTSFRTATSRRGRALIVTNYYPPHIGGLEKVVAQQVSSLRQHGWDVTVMTCRLPAAFPHQAHGRVIGVPALNLLDRRRGIPFAPVSPSALPAFVREAGKADFVHVHDVLYPISHCAALAARVTRTPLYLTQHIGVVDHPSRAVTAVQQALYRVPGRAIFRQAERIVAYNSNVVEFLRRDGGVPDNRLVQTRNGIDADYFSPAADAERLRLRSHLGLPNDHRPLVLFVGRSAPKKGLDLLLQIPAEDFYLVAVGEPDPHKPAVPRPNQLLLGPKGQDEVRDLCRAADVLAAPSADEVMTLVMQEALSCGMPVIAAHNGGYDTLDLPGNVVTLVKRTSECLAKAIHNFVALPEAEVAVRRASARSYALTNLSWSSNYAREYAMYKPVIEKVNRQGPIVAPCD